VEGVSDTATLVVHDIIFAAYRCPNEALAWEGWVHDDISRVPLLARLCKSAIFSTKLNNGGRQMLVA
jgi:hypothetical protein